MALNGVAVLSNGDKEEDEEEEEPLQRAEDAEELLNAVQTEVLSFIKSADVDASAKSEGHGLQQPGQGPRTALVEHHPPKKLKSLLNLSLPEPGRGRAGLIQAVQDVLKYSVNTWDQGFMDKLYSAITPVGLAAELVLTALNTNVHTYKVSPALTLIEKHTSKALASMFGLHGPDAGGVSQPGGSAANQSSMVIARNNLFPETKSDGYGDKRFVLFTSAHGHYSVEKAAQMFGFGSKAVRSVPVDERGCMRADALDTAIRHAQQNGETPFYVSATAGTTVLGSFDPLDSIADICHQHHLWFHVDASWGGPVIFSLKQRHKLRGIERADSITMCPQKMMGVPLTCAFLLGADLRKFHKAMTLPAGYLFHSSSSPSPAQANGLLVHDASALDSESPDAHPHTDEGAREFHDLADLTPQCGRRGDSLKLYLCWTYYGTQYYADYIDHAFRIAAHLAHLLAANAKFSLLSANPPPCVQVCFYYDRQSGIGRRNRNSRITEEVTRALIPRGFMTDHAPGEDGHFFRVVVNGQTRKGTVEGLVRAIEDLGSKVRFD